MDKSKLSTVVNYIRTGTDMTDIEFLDEIVLFMEVNDYFKIEVNNIEKLLFEFVTWLAERYNLDIKLGEFK